MSEVILISILVLFSAVLQTSTGFGFSIVATPFLLFFFEPREAIQINLILSLVISCVLIAKIRQDVDFNILKRFIFGSAAGLPVGIILFLILNMTILKLGVSLLILVLTLLLMMKFHVKKTNTRDYFVGGISGSLTTSIGIPGPPILLYFSGTNTQKETLRATTLAFYLWIYAVSLLIQIIFAGTTKTVWTSSGLALPILLVGMVIGQLLFRRINQQAFRICTYIILVFTGVTLFIKSWEW
ncbi:sulfite exporter TauE/SafE family protein [Alkalihalobacillus sp. AL-G]|uniref:sulfite exporter TauE/SafE family protein n=1 Tax=Alkalihalobacillus sp. AL-G TaxID=2926399 RepID=UPI002729EC77|nr:sulfite exporter TauE/SafE family protein [Alkalihalobacillus sp. AL-G]WLD93318.1 sulfite exporter TauE/SafE family protein [Alkalihalobacillus sp. AL-G]